MKFLEMNWGVVEILMKVLENSKVSQFMSNFKNWISLQKSENEFRVLFRAIESRILCFNDSQIEYFGNQLSTIFKKIPASKWILSIIGTRPLEKDEENKWINLCNTFFSNICSNLKPADAMLDCQKSVFVFANENNWPVEIHADQVLAEKVKSSQNYSQWLELLKKLIIEKFENTKEAVLERLKANNNIEESLQTGISVVWKNSIDDDSARALANLLINLSNDQVNALNDELNKIMDCDGADRFVEILINQLRDDPQWLYERIHLLLFIANHVSENMKQKFDNYLIKLLTSPDNNMRLNGLEVVKRCKLLSAEIKNEVKHLSNDENTNIAESAKVIIEKY
jgi:hypothetical protein